MIGVPAYYIKDMPIEMQRQAEQERVRREEMLVYYAELHAEQHMEREEEHEEATD